MSSYPIGTKPSSSYDTTVKLWDPSTGKSITLRGHEYGVTSLAFSPDGQRLVSASWDQTARLWTRSRPSAAELLTRHADPVWGLAFSRDGRFLATGSYDGTIKLWNPVNRELQGTITARGGAVHTLAFSPDSRMLAVGCSRWNDDGSGGESGGLELWDVVTRTTIAGPLDHLEQISSVEFSPDGAILAFAGGDQRVVLWNTATREIVAEKQLVGGPEWEKTCLVFSGDGKLLCGAGRWGSTLLWDVAPPYNEVELPRIRGAQDEGKLTWCAAFLDGSRTLAIGTISGEVELWDVAQRLQVGTLSPRSGAFCRWPARRMGGHSPLATKAPWSNCSTLPPASKRSRCVVNPPLSFPFDSPWTAISWLPAAKSPCSFGRHPRLRS